MRLISTFLFVSQVRNVTSVDKKILQCAKELATFKDEYLKVRLLYAYFYDI